MIRSRPVLVDVQREPRRLGRLAWWLCAASEACVVACIVLVVGRISLSEAVDGYLATNLSMAVIFSAVGGLVAGSRPRNVVGWLFLGHGACFAVATLFGTIANTQAAAYSDEGLRVLAALFMGLWPLGIGIALPLVVQLFPTGRPVSPRWPWLIALTIVTGLGFVAQMLLSPGGFAGIVPGRAVPPLVSPATSHALDPLWAVVPVLMGGVLALSVAALVVRFRRSRGVERLQLTWLVWAVAIVAILNVQRWVTNEGPILFLFTLPLVPAAAAVAILRHDLYDIRIIVNRTLVYGLLTGFLGAGYAGVVVILGELFGRIGQPRPSWAVASATLAVAAVFRPMRRAIQDAVDRRFYRRRYDAAKTIQGFSARLHHGSDRDTLLSEVAAILHQTLQPTTVSLWLRPPTAGSRRTRFLSGGAGPARVSRNQAPRRF
jgi:two-component system NarL family sensor kinase